MSEQTTEQETSDARFVFLVEKIRLVPDKLVAAQVDLRRLCQSDGAVTGNEATLIVANACALLHSALADVMAVLEYADDWRAEEEGGEVPLADRISSHAIERRG
jgi:ATP-dependent protease HslVU (ClpYQ) peptidase subunit